MCNRIDWKRLWSHKALWALIMTLGNFLVNVKSQLPYSQMQIMIFPYRVVVRFYWHHVSRASTPGPGT